MDSLVAKDAERTEFLEAFYDFVDGISKEIANIKDVGNELKWSDDKLSKTVQWLADRELLKAMTGGGGYSITRQGVDAVENARRKTANEPSLNSKLELAVVVLTTDELRSVEEVLTEIGRADIEAKLVGDDQHEFIADRNTVLEQMKSPKPKKEIVFAALRGIRKFCFAVGSVVAATKINQVIG